MMSSEIEIIHVSSPNIIIVKNFLNKQDIEKIMSTSKWSEDIWEIDFKINYPKQEDMPENIWSAIKRWDGMCINISRKNKEYDLDYNFYDKVSDDIKGYVSQKFNVDNLRREQYLINRWRIGRQQSPHLDYFIEDDRDHDYEMLAGYGLDKNSIDSFKKSFKTKHYSSLVYLNDDYEGGELYFPQHDNYAIKPEPGTLVCFKGDDENLHGVKEITEGTRYTLSMFWEDLDYMNKINPKV